MDICDVLHEDYVLKFLAPLCEELGRRRSFPEDGQPVISRDGQHSFFILLYLPSGKTAVGKIQWRYTPRLDARIIFSEDDKEVEQTVTVSPLFPCVVGSVVFYAPSSLLTVLNKKDQTAAFEELRSLSDDFDRSGLGGDDSERTVWLFNKCKRFRRSRIFIRH